MADSFQGSDYIEIKPGDTNIPYSFAVTVATSSTLNDGALPYNSTVCTATVTAHSEDGIAIAAGDLIHAATDMSFSSNVIIPRLTYSSSIGAGLYHLKFLVTASINATTSEVMKTILSFNRLYVRSS